MALAAVLLVLTFAVPAHPAIGQELPLRLESVVTIGCDVCVGPEQFGLITALAVDQDVVAIADRDAPHVRVFDHTGQLVASFGRDGDGPGELRMPMAIGLAGDQVAVVDMRRQRVVVLDQEGREVAADPLPGFPLEAAFVGGGLSLRLTTTNFRDRTAGVWSWRGPESDFEQMIESVPSLQLGDPDDPLFFSTALSANGAFALAVASGEYVVPVYDAGGSLLVTAARDVERIPKTSAEIEAEQEARRATVERLAARGVNPSGPPLDAAIDPLRDHFGMRAVAYDEADRLWVRTERGAPGETVFDVFSPSGRFLGELSVPGRLRNFVLANGLLTAVTLDDFDVPSVTMWRVSTIEPGQK